MDRDELAAWLRLALTPEIGNIAARRLLAAFGLPANIFSQPAAALQEVVTPAQARALGTVPPDLDERTDTTLLWLAEPGEAGERRILTLADAAYPPGLLQTEDPPLMLYLLGRRV